MKTAVVILAAGRGSRAVADGTAPPKQYRALGGVPVLTRTLTAFAGHDRVGDIVTVIHADEQDMFETTAAPFAGRLRPPVIGGATRQASALAGLETLEPLAPQNVLIHDAARPFVSHRLIDRVIGGLSVNEAVVPALPVADTLKRERGGCVAETLERASLWAAQTPQGFRFDAILDAHKAAAKAGEKSFTDDASIAEWRGARVALVEGERGNVKLTTADDFEMAEKQIAADETRVGQGFDVHAFGDGGALVLCGVTIPHTRGLTGHSDADVGLHALTDALLGAIGDGDIGTHFPPDDPAWKGVASARFLSDAATRVRGARRRDRQCRRDPHLRGAENRAAQAGNGRGDRGNPGDRAGPRQREGDHDRKARGDRPWRGDRGECHGDGSHELTRGLWKWTRH